MVSVLGMSLPFLLVIVGIGLAIAEAIAPGAHFIVLGVALILAGLVGLTLGAFIPFLAGPLSLAILILAFGGTALFVYREFEFYGGHDRARTTDSSSLRGRTGRVTRQVTATGGEVKLDKGGFNPNYQARSIDEDIPEGTEIMVVDPGGGNVVTVEALEAIEDPIERELAAGREEAAARDDHVESEREHA